jgi:tetratricopeptide (TPR) repeat protein
VSALVLATKQAKADEARHALAMRLAAWAEGEAAASWPRTSSRALALWAWRHAAKSRPDEAAAADRAREIEAETAGDDRTVLEAAASMVEGVTAVTVDRIVAALAHDEGGGDAADDALHLAKTRDDAGPTRPALRWIRAAVNGERSARALALADVAETAPAAVASRLFCIASEEQRHAGDTHAARRLAERAVAADPEASRARVALADAVVDDGHTLERTELSALERAASRVLPRARWTKALALGALASKQTAVAVAWAQRTLLVRPWDPACLDLVVDAAIAARSAVDLRETLAWNLAQPRPSAELSTRLARALPELAALDVDAAISVARRALDVLGPNDHALHAAMDDVAFRAGDPGFRAALRERRGGEVSAADALEVAELRRASGDTSGAVRALVRALDSGAPPDDVAALASRIEWESLDGDGQLAQAKLSAELAWKAARKAGPRDRARAREAWSKMRILGAARWDLASDIEGAIDTWLRAARLVVEGFNVLRDDLCARVDPALAGRFFEERANAVRTEGDPAAIRASLLVQAAHLAHRRHDPSTTFRLASEALATDPRATSALALLDDLVVDPHAFSRLHFQVAAQSAGHYGRRASHMRAARFLERRGEAALAFEHATEALLALPAEGAALQLFSRVTERTGNFARASQVLEDVAQTTSGSGRALWLLYAAALAGPLVGTPDIGALEHRVELLLAALVVAPDKPTFILLEDALQALLARAPEEREALLVRVGRSARALASKLDGPEGARVALGFARVRLERFDEPAEALESLADALSADPDVDDFASLMPYVDRLAAAEGAHEAVSAALAAAAKPYANVGTAALRLLAALAAELGDTRARAQALVLAVERDELNEVLVEDAIEAVQKSASKSWSERLVKRVGDRAVSASPRRSSSPAASLSPQTQVSPEDISRAEDSQVDRMIEALGPSTPPPPAPARNTPIEYPAAAAVAIDEIDHTPVDLPPIEFPEGPRQPRSERPTDGSIEASKGRAQVAAASGDVASAEEEWRRARDLDPDDVEAERALEALLVSRAAYAELAELLSQRAERLARAGDAESLRATRFRRAALLEQRLGRVSDACNELATLLVESPDNESALGYLADLYERMGEALHATTLWRRAAAIARDDVTRTERQIRAARSSIAAGDPGAALALLEQALLARPGHLEALEMRVEAARAADDDQSLGEALVAWADIAPLTAEARSDLLIEAAQATARSGDARRALERAQRAARLTPDRPAAQLFARGLEYRQRGAGAPTEAKATIVALQALRGPLGVDDGALHAFLLAEALDTVQGGGVGNLALEERRRVGGEHPLLSLALAERAVAQWKFIAAVPLFQHALTSDLLGMRRRGAVALSAADAALRAEQAGEATAFLEEAARDPDLRAVALRRLAHVVAAAGDVARSREVLLELARGSHGEDRAKTLAQLGRALLASMATDERAEGVHVFLQAIDAAPRESVLEAQLRAELSTLRQRLSIAPPGLSPVPAKVSTAPAVSIEELTKAVEGAATAADRADRKVSLADAYAYEGKRERVEPLLWEAFAEGSVLAASRLAAILDEDAGRVAERIRVRRRLVESQPGSPEQLRALHAAALADRNFVYARAIEHVLRAFDPGAGPVPPPPLGGQDEQPGILALLTRHAHEPPGEAMGIVWEGGQSAFARAPADYQVSGVERLAPGASSPIGRLYEVALRLLDAPQVPVYVRRTDDPLISQVALLQPAAAVLVGDAREDNLHTRAVLGYAIGAALPQSALVLGLPPDDARNVWLAVMGAFGPAGLGFRLDAATAGYAETLWQVLPGRSQRRLRDLLARQGAVDFESLVARAKQSARRVGFFLTGDFGDAATRLVAELSPSDVRRLREPGGLEALCAELPDLADMVRLAVRPEYADARWRPAPQGPTRGNFSSQRLRVR